MRLIGMICVAYWLCRHFRKFRVCTVGNCVLYLSAHEPLIGQCAYACFTTLAWGYDLLCNCTIVK